MTKDVSIEQLRRWLILLGEAQSSISQCCSAIGEARTARIQSELSSVQRDVMDLLNMKLGA